MPSEKESFLFEAIVQDNGVIEMTMKVNGLSQEDIYRVVFHMISKLNESINSADVVETITQKSIKTVKKV